jgi:hypothetical protein
MRIMVDDYFLYLVELLHVDDRARELMRNITLDIPPEYLDTDYEGFFLIKYSLIFCLLTLMNESRFPSHRFCQF